MQGKFILGMVTDTIQLPLGYSKEDCSTLACTVYSFFHYITSDKCLKSVETQSGVINLHFQLYTGTIEQRRLYEKYQSQIVCIDFELKEENIKGKNISDPIASFELLASLSNLKGEELEEIKYRLRVEKINQESINEIREYFGIYKKADRDVYYNYETLICKLINKK